MERKDNSDSEQCRRFFSEGKANSLGDSYRNSVQQCQQFNLQEGTANDMKSFIQMTIDTNTRLTVSQSRIVNLQKQLSSELQCFLNLSKMMTLEGNLVDSFSESEKDTDFVKAFLKANQETVKLQEIMQQKLSIVKEWIAAPAYVKKNPISTVEIVNSLKNSTGDDINIPTEENIANINDSDVANNEECLITYNSANSSISINIPESEPSHSAPVPIITSTFTDNLSYNEVVSMETTQIERDPQSVDVSENLEASMLPPSLSACPLPSTITPDFVDSEEKIELGEVFKVKNENSFVEEVINDSLKVNDEDLTSSEPIIANIIKLDFGPRSEVNSVVSRMSSYSNKEFDEDGTQVVRKLRKTTVYGPASKNYSARSRKLLRSRPSTTETETKHKENVLQPTNKKSMTTSMETADVSISNNIKAFPCNNSKKITETSSKLYQSFLMQSTDIQSKPTSFSSFKIPKKRPSSDLENCDGGNRKQLRVCHPLENGKILEKIFSFINSPTDLATIRLISKAWKDASLTKWRTSATVIIKFVTSKPQNSKGVTFKEFLDCCKNNLCHLNDIPFTKYSLMYLKLTTSEIKNIREKTLFWKLLGKKMTELQLKRCSCESAIIPDYFYEIIFKMAPKIRKLSLADNKFNYPPVDSIAAWSNVVNRKALGFKKRRHITHLEIKGLLPFNLSTFAPLFPRMVTLTLELGNKNEGKDFLQRDLKFQQDLGSFPRIQCLDMSFKKWIQNYRPDPFQLDHLRGAEFPLKSFKFRVDYKPDPVWEAGVNETISSYFKTLNTLEIYRSVYVSRSTQYYNWNVDWEKDYILLELPVKMIHLEEVYLHGQVVTSFGFLEGMPNAKKVYVNLVRFVKSATILKAKPGESGLDNEGFPMTEMTQPQEITWRMCQLPGLSEAPLINLKFLHIDIMIPSEGLKLLKKWAPRLASLHVVADNSQFWMICKVWGNLEELTLLYGSPIDDDGIAGVENLWKMDQICTSLVQIPYVSYLKELKRLTIRAHCNQGRLTEKSVYRGFLMLPKLESLTAHVSQNMSHEAKAAAEKGISNVQFIECYGDKCICKIKSQIKKKGIRIERADCCAYQWTFKVNGYQDYYEAKMV